MLALEKPAFVARPHTRRERIHQRVRFGELDGVGIIAGKRTEDTDEVHVQTVIREPFRARTLLVRLHVLPGHRDPITRRPFTPDRRKDDLVISTFERRRLIWLSASSAKFLHGDTLVTQRMQSFVGMQALNVPLRARSLFGGCLTVAFCTILIANTRRGSDVRHKETERS